MKSQTGLHKNLSYLTETQEQTLFMRKALKTTNFLFRRNQSSKLKKDIKDYKASTQDQEENKPFKKNFVPKLKSKQLLREPKFFFSLQRKKQKKQYSEPFFEAIRFNNCEMKGSKTKNFYTKIYCSRKTSSQQVDDSTENNLTPYRKSTQKQSPYTSQASRKKRMIEIDSIQRNFSYNPENQSAVSVKTIKRPRLNENISFLIRRKKEMKNKSTLTKINQSRHKMSHFFDNFEENKI